MTTRFLRLLLATAGYGALTGCVEVAPPSNSSNNNDPPSTRPPVHVPPPPPAGASCIDAGDVLNIPTGSARGSAFSGRYRSLTNFLLDCTACELDTNPDAGSCTPRTVDPTLVYDVTQTDGRIVFDDGETRVVGGVDSDGSFRIGAYATPTSDSGVRTGEALALIEGRFDDTGYSATFTVRITINDPDDPDGVLDGQGVSRVRAELVE